MTTGDCIRIKAAVAAYYPVALHSGIIIEVILDDIVPGGYKFLILWAHGRTTTQNASVTEIGWYKL